MKVGAWTPGRQSVFRGLVNQCLLTASLLESRPRWLPCSRFRNLTQGAPERLLEHCTTVLIGGRELPLTQEVRDLRARLTPLGILL
jgi:hypothetical protein